MTIPPWQWPARVWAWLAGICGAFVLLGNVIGAFGKVEPFFPAHREFVREELAPAIVIGLQNTLEIIESQKQAIKVRLQMAGSRLSQVPGDTVAQDAWEAANDDMQAVLFRENEAQCSLRVARGLGCSR